MTGADRLLILSCSRHKSPEKELIPALERYNGPAFHVLRKYIRTKQSVHLPSVYVISAKFGLINVNQPIPDYDQMMTDQRAVELQPAVTAKLETILAERPYKEIFLHVSRVYLQALNGFERTPSPETKVIIPSGPPGGKLAKLRNWLHVDLQVSDTTECETKAEGLVYFKGGAITHTAEEILDIARQALVENRGQVTNYYSWYVLVDGVKVAPKWLVSQLTGNPVSSFNTGQARRLFSQLGIEVGAL